MDITAIMDVVNGTATPIAFAVIVLVMWWKDRERNYEREEKFLEVIQSNTDAINALKTELERSKV